MSKLFETGIRPAIDAHLLKLSQEKRDYKQYWSASSAGYCQRKVIFDRLGLPEVREDARKQRVFTAGHIFHEWIQGITREANLSVAQEEELIDDKLMIKGHIDELTAVDDRLILYDYKTQSSRAFAYKDEMSHFHYMQLGTYMYMLRKLQAEDTKPAYLDGYPLIEEGRILKISKDDLRMTEEQLLWTPKLERDVYQYWATLNGYWKSKKLPACTCDKYQGGFMAKEAYNPYYYNGKPCSLDWFAEHPEVAKRWREEDDATLQASTAQSDN